MLQTWQAQVIKTILNGVFLPRKHQHYTKEILGAKYHLVTSEGLFIEAFVPHVLIETDYQDNQCRIRDMGHIHLYHQSGAIVQISGTILQDFGMKIIVKPTEITEIFDTVEN